MEFIQFYWRQRVLFDALQEYEDLPEPPDESAPVETRASFWASLRGTLDAMMDMDDESAVALRQRRLREHG